MDNRLRTLTTHTVYTVHKSIVSLIELCITTIHCKTQCVRTLTAHWPHRVMNYWPSSTSTNQDTSFPVVVAIVSNPLVCRTQQLSLLHLASVQKQPVLTTTASEPTSLDDSFEYIPPKVRPLLLL